MDGLGTIEPDAADTAVAGDENLVRHCCTRLRPTIIRITSSCLQGCCGREGRGRCARSDNPSDSQSRRERSEEHTSELQSLMRISYAVFCLKKTTNNIMHIN